jgi:hypothetical protein
VSENKDAKETTEKKAVPKSKPSEKADIAARNTDKNKASAYHLEEGHAWANAWKFAAGAAVIGLGSAFALGSSSDPKRLAFSYLFAFMAILTPALGTLFFILQQHLTASGWSVTIRRTAEIFASGLGIFLFLFAPVWVMRARLFPWLNESPEHAEVATTHTTGADLAAQPAGNETPEQRHERDQMAPANANANSNEGHGAAGMAGAGMVGGPGLHEPVMNANERGEHGDPNELEEEHTLHTKRAYLNEGFFTVRAVVYLVLWAWLGWTFLARSTKQDETKDPKITNSTKRFSMGAVYIFGFSLTFAAFDWIMSLDPLWFSTVFGVYVFAGSAVSAYALIILTTMGLRASGKLVKEINVEHYHDMGKLMFGFVVFWAYIGFAQFMLIWYAAIPEETTFFHNRWDHGPWAIVSMSLVLLNFIFPFFVLISHNAKRKLGILAFGAAWLFFMHMVDIYWLIMPNFGQDGFAVSWLDAACLIGVAGAYFAVVFYRMSKVALIPVGDPRLQRALHFENM